MTTRLPLVIAALLTAPSAAAQGLPQHEPLNPTSASRSGLYAQPYRALDPRGWQLGVRVSYGNAIESDSGRGVRYLLDAEVLRVRLAASRDLSSSTFVSLDLGVGGADAGFADGFFVAYHKLIHFSQPERAARPRNVFGYVFDLPAGHEVVRAPVSLALGDTRATIGVRHSQSLQSVLSVTLPTATGPEGYGRGTVSVSTVQTVRLALSSRFLYEGTFGLGLTPRHGALAGFQRTTFASASTGISIRLWGSQSVYGYFFYHTPYYHDTGLRSLDRRELTGDFGWLARGRDGRAWFIGMSEDLAPGDPGIDLTLKVGRTW